MKQIRTRKEINELCESIIKLYEGEEYIEKPVDIAGLATKYFKLKVYMVNFAVDNKERLGCITDGKSMYKLIYNGKVGSYSFPKDTILLDKSLKTDSERAKKRFTLAHEVYHYIDNVINGNQSYGYSSDLKESSVYNPDELQESLSIREWAADCGAAALLMPKGLIHTTIRTIYEESTIPIYGNNMLKAEDKLKIVEMADFLGVSYTALFIRLKELRFFKYHKAAEYLAMTMGGD